MPQLPTFNVPCEGHRSRRCERCNRTYKPTAGSQRYCPPCGREVVRERSNSYERLRERWCVRCHRLRKHRARGLCVSCYSVVSRRGERHLYPLLRLGRYEPWQFG